MSERLWAPFFRVATFYKFPVVWARPLSSRGMKGCCEQYTIVLPHQRQETDGLDVCLNPPPSYPCCHVFNSLLISMWQINRYGWTQWEGGSPLIELTRSDALVTTLRVLCNSISKTNASLGGGWTHVWLASWVCSLSSYTGPWLGRSPCFVIAILGIVIWIMGPAFLFWTGPHQFCSLLWSQGWYCKLNGKQKFSSCCMSVKNHICIWHKHRKLAHSLLFQRGR